MRMEIVRGCAEQIISYKRSIFTRSAKSVCDVVLDSPVSGVSRGLDIKK